MYHLHRSAHGARSQRGKLYDHQYFSVLNCVDDQMKLNLDDTLYKYEVQLSETTKLKGLFDCTDKKLIEYFSCQLNKLNMSYDSAIKIINEKRKHFTELLKQSLSEEKRRLDSEKSKIYKRLEKLSESMKPLKECATNLDRMQYEELYKILVQKNSDLKQIADVQLKGVPDLVYACFRDSIKLSDLGSIQYLKSADTKDFIISKNKTNSPGKECDRREKCNSINKNNNRASDLDTGKTHRKEKKSNRNDKTCTEEIVQNNECKPMNPPVNASKPKEDGQKINESLYPQTSRGKNNYFAISSYHPPNRAKATPSKHKNPKVATNSSHTSAKAPDSLTPKPAKEASETMIKYGTSNLTGISRLTKGCEKENMKNSELDLGYNKVQTTREIPDKIGTCGAGTNRGASANPTVIGLGINPVIEEPANENMNDKSIVKIMEEDNFNFVEKLGGSKEKADPKEFNIFEANILNSEYANALNNTSVVAHKLEASKSNQRSTSTSHRQAHTHIAKYAGGTKNGKATVLQTKQVPQPVLKIPSREKASSNHPPQATKKKHVTNLLR